jgi:hypothetical protein
MARAGINVWTTHGPYEGLVRALVIDPTTPSTLYAGTHGVGVYQSTDSGGSWRAVNTGLSGSALFVNALAIDRTTPSTLYAGTNDVPHSPIGHRVQFVADIGAWKRRWWCAGENSRSN